MKRISIDTNYNYFSPLRSTIYPFVISAFNLSVGVQAIGFQDDQEWEGETTVSSDRDIGRYEGRESAYPEGERQGEITVVTKMLADSMNIKKIIKYTRLSRKVLENIQHRLANSK